MALNYLVDAMDSKCVTSIGQERQARSVIISRVTNRHRLKEYIYVTTRRGKPTRTEIPPFPNSNSNSELNYRTKTATHHTDHECRGTTSSNEGWRKKKKKKKENDEKINVEYRSGQDIRSGDPNHVTRRE